MYVARFVMPPHLSRKLTVDLFDKDAELHAQLVQACVDELLECLQDESTLKLWRAKCALNSC